MMIPLLLSCSVVWDLSKKGIDMDSELDSYLLIYVAKLILCSRTTIHLLFHFTVRLDVIIL